nr:MAG TPA: DNA N-6-adenine-methyltransferase [Caudoviricetes sp.]
MPISKVYNMNTQFERLAKPTDEWYAPKEIIDALGKFDLDPCAPVHPLWKTADVMYNKDSDGLRQEWFGRVWFNPPYSKPLMRQFVERLSEHGNGIVLLFNRCDSYKFQDIIFERATAMKFLRNRIKFFRPDGTRGYSPGCGSILIAFGEENAEVLRTCDIAGKYVRIN